MWKWFSLLEEGSGTSSQDYHDYYCKKFLKRIVSVGNHDEVVVGGDTKLEHCRDGRVPHESSSGCSK